MRITFILSTISAKGGVQRFVGNMGSHLNELGHDVYYYSLHSNVRETLPSFNKALVKDALTSSPAKLLGRFVSHRWAAKSPKVAGVPLVLFANVYIINKAVHDTNPDVVFVNLGHTFVGLLKKFYPEKVFICYYHTPPSILSNPVSRSLSPFEKYTLDKTVSITNSYHVARRIKREFKVSTRIVHPGIDIEKFPPIKGKDDGRTLLYFSRIHPLKRQVLLVETLSSILKKRNLRLIIAGDITVGWKYYLKELHKTVKHLGLKKHVIIITRVPEEKLQDIYSKATICLHAGKGEPFGITVLEAMASGKPVIAPNVGGPAEIIVDRKTGFLVGDDPEEWYQSIEALLDNPTLYSEMSKNARLRAEKFSWHNIAKRMESLIMENLGRNISDQIN